MKKQLFLIVTSMMLLFVLLAVGAYFILQTQETDQKPALDLPLSSGASKEEAIPSFQVQGAETTRSATQLPGPDKFTLYEQYKTAQSTQYIDVATGQGESLDVGDLAAVVYQGWLTNGQLFDQSKINDDDQIEPIVLELGAGQVIKGWEDGLIGMKVGGKRRLIIPPAFGYGQAGQDPIPPDSLLIFDVELLEMQKKQATEQGGL